MRRSPAWLSLLLMMMGASTWAQQDKELPAIPQTEPGVMPAVYKVREVRFSYNSSTSIYTCSALEARVKSIFLALGARDDLEVRASSCDEMIVEQEFENTLERGNKRWDPMNRTWGRSGGTSRDTVWEDPYDRFQSRGTDREQNAYIRARVLMPVELTHEVMDEIKRDKSRRELVSRVTGDPTAKQNDPVWFPAHRQPITLSRESIGLEPEECELLDQMSNTVFKELGLRVTGKGRRCSRFGGSRIAPEMTVEALVMAPVGETSLPQIKLEGEGDPTAPEVSSEASSR